MHQNQNNLHELNQFLTERTQQQFFGVIELHFQNGHIVSLKEIRTHKLLSRDTRKEKLDEHGK